MIVSNRRYEITLHGDLPPLVLFLSSLSPLPPIWFGNKGPRPMHKLMMPVGANPTILMRGLNEVTHTCGFFNYLKGGEHHS